jgi:hypothetical protein
MTRTPVYASNGCNRETAAWVPDSVRRYRLVVSRGATQQPRPGLIRHTLPSPGALRTLIAQMRVAKLGVICESVAYEANLASTCYAAQ